MLIFSDGYSFLAAKDADEFRIVAATYAGWEPSSPNLDEVLEDFDPMKSDATLAATIEADSVAGVDYPATAEVREVSKGRRLATSTALEWAALALERSPEPTDPGRFVCGFE